MKYKIILQRLSEHKDVKKPNVAKIEDSTLGKLSVNEIQENGTLKEIWSCFTCENIGESTDTPKQDKRIVAREYALEWTDSIKNAALSRAYPHFKCPNGRNKALLLTCDSVLPSFRNRRILIHIGNYPQDTEGCLLFGYKKGNGVVFESTECIKDFFELVQKEGVENFTLIIKEIKE